MKYFEPFQRLDQYVYLKAENAVYVKSSVNVQLPIGSTLIGKDPFYNSSIAATMEYLFSVDNSEPDPYIFEQVRLIKFFDNVPLVSASMDTVTLTKTVRDAIIQKLGNSTSYTVTCIVYNNKNAIGGQVTNTISNQGDIAIL